jgi:hypothetical protein
MDFGHDQAGILWQLDAGLVRSTTTFSRDFESAKY